MSKNQGWEVETPETDPKIILSPELTFVDNDVVYLNADPCTDNCTEAWTGWFRHSSGDVYSICKDKDGYLVKLPGGNTQSLGTGYTWRDVKSSYGLSGVKAYQCRCGGTCR